MRNCALSILVIIMMVVSAPVSVAVAQQQPAPAPVEPADEEGGHLQDFAVVGEVDGQGAGDTIHVHGDCNTVITGTNNHVHGQGCDPAAQNGAVERSADAIAGATVQKLSEAFPAIADRGVSPWPLCNFALLMALVGLVLIIAIVIIRLMWPMGRVINPKSSGPQTVPPGPVGPAPYEPRYEGDDPEDPPDRPKSSHPPVIMPNGEPQQWREPATRKPPWEDEGGFHPAGSEDLAARAREQAKADRAAEEARKAQDEASTDDWFKTTIVEYRPPREANDVSYVAVEDDPFAPPPPPKQEPMEELNLDELPRSGEEPLVAPEDPGEADRAANRGRPAKPRRRNKQGRFSLGDVAEHNANKPGNGQGNGNREV